MSANELLQKAERFIRSVSKNRAPSWPGVPGFVRFGLFLRALLTVATPSRASAHAYSSTAPLLALVAMRA